jgi:hypothetical protein
LVAYLACVAATSIIAVVAPRFSLVCLIVLTAVYFSFAFLTDSTATREAESEDRSPQKEGSAVHSNVVHLDSTPTPQLRERA